MQALIRPAAPGEADLIRDLVRAAYARWVPVIGREPRPMIADYATALQQHRIDLLLRDGKIVGLIEYRSEPDHLWIENIAIRPEHQGRGLGRDLLAHAEAVAEEMGLTHLRLLTNGAFDANIRLYLRQGFHIERTEPFLDGKVHYFRKRLGHPDP